jgi:hypothetical protein
MICPVDFLYVTDHLCRPGINTIDISEECRIVVEIPLLRTERSLF